MYIGDRTLEQLLLSGFIYILLLHRYGITIVGDGLTLFFSSFFPNYTQFQSASNIAWYNIIQIMNRAIVFTLGTLLMSLNMAAIYSVLLFVTLSAFILQTVMSFIEISPIPGIWFYFHILMPSWCIMGYSDSYFSLYLFCRDFEYHFGKTFITFGKCAVWF